MAGIVSTKKPKIPSFKAIKPTRKTSSPYGVQRGAQTDYSTLGARPSAGVQRGGTLRPVGVRPGLAQTIQKWQNVSSPTPPLVDSGGGSLIGGDWEVQEAESNMAAQMARMRGDFTGGLRQAYIDWGGSDISQLGGLGQYIDADTIKKAVENKYSTTAQIAQQETRSLSNSRARRAAEGRLFGGGTVTETQDLLASAEGNRYAALRDFLSGGQAGLTGLADMESQLARQVAQARFAAAARAAEQYPGAFLGDEGALPVAGTPSGLSNSSAKAIPGGRLGSYRAPLRSGWRYGVGGQYMTANQFHQQRPQGSYSAYLAHLRRARGGQL